MSRKSTAPTFSATKIRDGVYEYRGHRIHKLSDDGEVEWVIFDGSGEFVATEDLLEDAKGYIDDELVAAFDKADDRFKELATA